MAWSLIGSAISYLGFVFSLFAVLEVQSLSHRYFAKQRLPDLKKQLGKVAISMTTLASTNLSDFRSDRFMGEAAVLMRQIKKIKVSDFEAVISRAEKAHSEIGVELKDGTNLDRATNDINAFWELHRALTELVDEIEEYNKGVQASL